MSDSGSDLALSIYDPEDKLSYYLHDKITECWLVEKRTIISLIVQHYN